MTEHSFNDWDVTNDGVMGGLSQGHVTLSNNLPVFSGAISIENNGGFTSAFTKVSTLSKDIKSIHIRIVGDGNTYQLRIRSEVMGYNLAYKIAFKTKINTVETQCFTLADFEASFRGRSIKSAPLLQAHVITHVGFLVSAKQRSHFSLAIHSIVFK